MALSEFSSFGKKKLGVHGACYAMLCLESALKAHHCLVLLIVLDILALAFAARINIFQEFFCECPLAIQ